MNRTLSELRRADPAIDRCLREIEAEARMSDDDAEHAAAGLVVMVAVAALVIVTVMAVVA